MGLHNYTSWISITYYTTNFHFLCVHSVELKTSWIFDDEEWFDVWMDMHLIFRFDKQQKYEFQFHFGKKCKKLNTKSIYRYKITWINFLHSLKSKTRKIFISFYSFQSTGLCLWRVVLYLRLLILNYQITQLGLGMKLVLPVQLKILEIIR